VHCLNTLLQGSYFTEIDLAMVAQELDKQEKKLMMEMGTETEDFLKYMAEDSGNVADSGDYSIQVLQQALGGGWDLKCLPVSSPEVADALTDPLKENAFICNLSNHWFAIRKIDNKWYNLNSLNEKPELVSDFYLSLYLATLANSGWSIFVVRGDLPPVTPSTITSEGGRWIPVEQCVAKKPQQKQRTDEDDLAAAIALSLSEPSTKSPAKPSSPPPSSSSSSSKFFPSPISPSSFFSTSTPTIPLPSSFPQSASSFSQPTLFPSSYPPTSTSTTTNSQKRTLADLEGGVDDNDAELQAVLEASELEAAIAASLQPK